MALGRLIPLQDKETANPSATKKDLIYRNAVQPSQKILIVIFMVERNYTKPYILYNLGELLKKAPLNYEAPRGTKSRFCAIAFFGTLNGSLLLLYKFVQTYCTT